MENVFYFPLKALFVLKIIKLLSWHILSNTISAIFQWTMKCDRLIEYNMRNIFLEKSYTKCGGETFSRPFSKNSKLSIPLDQLSKVLHGLFLLYVKLSAMEMYWN